MTAREREINQTKDLTRFSCAFSKNARAFFSGAAKKGDNTHTVHSGAHQCPPALYINIVQISRYIQQINHFIYLHLYCYFYVHISSFFF